jgi:hypothetical protein
MSRVECSKLSDVSTKITVAIFRVAIAMFAEKFGKFQHWTLLTPKSQVLHLTPVAKA